MLKTEGKFLYPDLDPNNSQKYVVSSSQYRFQRVHKIHLQLLRNAACSHTDKQTKTNKQPQWQRLILMLILRSYLTSFFALVLSKE